MEVRVNELLAQPFGAADCQTLRHIYDWADTVPEVLEPLPQLRNRVALNDVKAYLDGKGCDSHV